MIGILLIFITSYTKLQELAKTLEPEKGHLQAMQCDVRKESDVIELFEKIRQEKGRLDVCVNNAGLAHPAPLLSGETDQWRDMLEVCDILR